MKDILFSIGDIVLIGLFVAGFILLDKKERKEKHRH